MAKITPFDKTCERQMKIADRRVEKEDYLGALNALLWAEKEFFDYQLFMRIADVYAEMGQLELSNKYWYKYMHFAPKDKVSACYEELAVNYFYLDNLWASGYYFHKKLSTDGFISKEGLDQEVMDFFSGEELKKHAYRIVYPYDKADYSFEKKNAKRAIGLGGFNEAVEILNKVPKQCRDEETSGDFAVAYLMIDDTESAEKIARESIEKNGESVTAYCNLSTVYDMRGDFDKSNFYYQKALSLSKGELSEYYKIATCAIEREDHEKVKECLEAILKDRPFECTMRFFQGINMMNLGDFSGAVNAFKWAHQTDPDDLIIQYYLEFAERIEKGGADSDKILPLKYVKELPKKIATKYNKSIRELVKNPEKILSVAKKPQTLNLIKWAMLYGSDRVMREGVMLLSGLDWKVFTTTANKILIDPEVRPELKRLLIYVLIMKGYKGRIGVVASSYYCQFSPKKLACEKSVFGGLFLSAYALCVSKTVFYDMDDFSALAKATDYVFSRFEGKVTEAEISNEELAGLILYHSGYENFKKPSSVAGVFEIDQKKLLKLSKMLNNKDEENSDDKNN